MTDADLRRLAKLASERFEQLDAIDGSDELLEEYGHHVFQFTVEGDGSLFIEIRDGDVSVRPDEYWEASDLPDPPTEILADAETIRAIFEGETTIVDEVWDENAQAPVYGPKMHHTSWISRLLKATRAGTGV